MLPFTLTPVNVPHLDSTVAELVRELVVPAHRIVVMCVIEDQATVLLHKVVIGKRVFWNIMVASGEFTGYIIDDCMYQEDAVALCDALGMMYYVEI
jgi:hypothetical protein